MTKGFIGSKKVLSLALLTILVLTLFTGCNQAEGDTGMMNISMNSNPIFETGSSEGTLMITNSNKNPQLVEIYTKNDNTLVYTGEVAVGGKIDTSKLLVDLPKGDHECTAYFTLIDPKTGERLGTAGAGIEITVLNGDTTVSEEAGDQIISVDLTDEFASISTPVTLPIAITGDGEVLTSDAVAITNNSTGPVVIKGMEIKGTNGWEVVAYGSFDSASTKVNTKQVAYQIVFGDEATGTVVNTTGEGTTNFPTPIRIEAGETLPLSYKADVPMQTEVYESLVVNEIAFIIALDNQ